MAKKKLLKELEYKKKRKLKNMPEGSTPLDMDLLFDGKGDLVR